jgi:hypothetical protein
MDEKTLRLLEVAGTWVSGIGTLLAVLVSLYLARRQTAVMIDLSAGHRIMVTPGQEHTPEFIVIRAVNAGQQPITLTHIGWRIGMFKKMHFVQVVDGNPLSSALPVQLAPGQQAQYFVPLNQSPNWIERFAENLNHWFPKISVETLKVSASATVGPTIYRKPERGLRKMLVDAQEKLSAKSDEKKTAEA